jgi:hypothetical protein
MGTGALYPWGQSGRGVKLTTDLQLLSILRKRINLIMYQYFEALCYNSKGRGFDSRWGSMDFSDDLIFPGIFMEVKSGERIKLTSPPSV